ncbi:hypothetical protein KAU25_05110 [Candidatus Bathyarchaeota archaeon]|nr:hypothetical protein [Candidatus Bathyarchaeota archaeon]
MNTTLGLQSRTSVLKSPLWIVAVSVVLLVFTMVSTSVLWIEPDTLGLPGKLPEVYWIGLALVASLWYVGRHSKHYLTLAFILTVAYLYVCPAIVRVPTWISNSYYPFGESVLITDIGYLVDRPATTLVSYFDWPLFLYFSSEFLLVTGIPHSILLKLFPLFSIAMYGLLAVLILRVTLKLPYAIFGAAWTLSSFFIRQHYFGPQGIAYVFFLLILWIVSALFFHERRHQRALIAIFIILFTLTTFLHPLTSFMSLIIIVALFFTSRLVLKRKSTVTSRLLLTSLTVWIGYNSLFARGFFNTAVQHFVDILRGARGISLYSEPSRIVGSEAMLVNFASSWGIVLLGGFIAVVAMLYAWRIRRRPQAERRGVRGDYVLFNVVLLVMLSAFAFAGEYGAHEAYQRAFMFGLVPLSFLCVSLLMHKPRILVVVLASLMFLNVFAQYGGDTYRLATETQLAGTAYFASNVPQDVTLIGKFTLYIRYHDPLKEYAVISIGLSYPYTTGPNSTAVKEALSEADYILKTQLEDNFYLFSLGLNPFEEVDYGKSHRIYDNWRLQLLKTND